MLKNKTRPKFLKKQPTKKRHNKTIEQHLITYDKKTIEIKKQPQLEYTKKKIPTTPKKTITHNHTKLQLTYNRKKRPLIMLASYLALGIIVKTTLNILFTLFT